jgi:hypothetical protein
MKTIPVKLAAAALGISNRAVVYRLEKGRLRGEQRPNQFGVMEWHIFPTKEIQDALKRLANNEAPQQTELDREEAAIDAEFRMTEDVAAHSAGDPLEMIKTLAEEMVRPLVQTLQLQTVALAEKDKQLEDVQRQLRLLPDLEKLAKERQKDAELKDFELQALKKQLEAVEQEREQARIDREQFEKLKGEMEKLKLPWWKKWFTTPEV